MTYNLELLFNDVWMKKEQLPGVLVEIEEHDGQVYGVVECTKEYAKAGSNERWPIYYCLMEDLEPLKK